MRYFAYFYANKGLHYAGRVSDTNKQRLITTICGIANSCRYANNRCTWYVQDERGVCVAAGYTLRSGQRIRVKGQDLEKYNTI